MSYVHPITNDIKVGQEVVLVNGRGSHPNYEAAVVTKISVRQINVVTVEKKEVVRIGRANLQEYGKSDYFSRVLSTTRDNYSAPTRLTTMADVNAWTAQKDLSRRLQRKAKVLVSNDAERALRQLPEEKLDELLALLNLKA